MALISLEKKLKSNQTVSTQLLNFKVKSVTTWEDCNIPTILTVKFQKLQKCS